MRPPPERYFAAVNCHCSRCNGVRLHMMPRRRQSKPKALDPAITALREGMAHLMGKPC